jgi:two-component system, sensor histidine kinase and response regulator
MGHRRRTTGAFRRRFVIRHHTKPPQRRPSASGGILNKARTARVSWPLIAVYGLAAIGGIVLVLGFARFNALHQEFLSANFDSVHGARTLLKARLLIEQAARDMELAAVLERRRPVTTLQNAERRLRNAEHYAAEGVDRDPVMRNMLVERIGVARSDLARIERQGQPGNDAADLQAAMIGLQQLARDIDAAELDRWGTLAGLNKELESRMRTLNQLLSATFFLFVGVMAVLAWALLRTRQAEAELIDAKHEIEAVQQTTLDASPIGIAFIDTADPDNRRVLTVNRQMAAIFGYEAEMMRGMAVRRLYSGSETYRRLTDAAPERLARGEVMREEVVMQRRNGMPFWCSLSIKAIDPDNLRRGVVWTCEDISERKAAEVELQQERQRAEEASRAKSDFLANMSHELRTPFTGLFGLLDLLDRSRLDDQQRRHLDMARYSAEHMQSIVNDILDFSKIEAGKLIIEEVPFKLRPLINAIAEPHHAAAERKGLTFVLNVIEPLAGMLRGDPVRIRQIVDNLLSNAIKFTGQGAVRLSVQTENVDDDTAVLRIAVEDTGVGVSLDKQMRIFDKFTQADSSTTRFYGGTGLGLAICKQLATLMNGQISLASTEGRGSSFVLTLHLPVAATAAEPAPSSASPDDERIDGAVIVLADDNEINRSMLSETLELYGAVVWAAATGEEAIRLVAEHKPDVVLMDCQMPGMDGLETTRRIRAAEASGCHLPIIAVTAFATSTYRESCLAPGMMDRFLAKPINLPQLLQAIRDLRRRMRPAHSEQPRLAPLSGRVLLVEDNPAILEATRHRIAGFGCTVDSVTDGDQALARLDKASADYDLVLMDCQLPVLDGRETTRRWRAIERERGLLPLAIIAVTADDRAETVASCHDAGMDAILAKPYSEAQLHDLLADWLR